MTTTEKDNPVQQHDVRMCEVDKHLWSYKHILALSQVRMGWRKRNQVWTLNNPWDVDLPLVLYRGVKKHENAEKRNM